MNQERYLFHIFLTSVFYDKAKTNGIRNERRFFFCYHFDATADEFFFAPIYSNEHYDSRSPWRQAHCLRIVTNFHQMGLYKPSFIEFSFEPLRLSSRRVADLRRNTPMPRLVTRSVLLKFVSMQRSGLIQ